jgi:hypothetical protein
MKVTSYYEKIQIANGHETKVFEVLNANDLDSQ